MGRGLVNGSAHTLQICSQFPNSALVIPAHRDRAAAGERIEEQDWPVTSRDGCMHSGNQL